MQKQLFDDKDAIDATVHQLGGAWIQEFTQVFSESTCQQYLKQLIETIPWQQASLRIAGKQIPVPRLQCWMGDAQSNYAYSGLKLKPEPWVQPVLAIKVMVEQLAETTFNSVLLNWYRDGNDSVAWHSDNEPELGQDPIVAAVSLGAERRFELKEKGKTKPRKLKMNLRNGSLVIMGKGLQRNWQHQVPKQKQIRDARISLTFRQIV